MIVLYSIKILFIKILNRKIRYIILQIYRKNLKFIWRSGYAAA